MASFMTLSEWEKAGMPELEVDPIIKSLKREPPELEGMELKHWTSFHKMLSGVKLTEREERFLYWMSAFDDYTAINFLSILNKVKHEG